MHACYNPPMHNTRQCHDFFGLLVCRFIGLVFYLLDAFCCIVPGFADHRIDQLLLCLLTAHPGDFFQLGALLGIQLIYLSCLFLQLLILLPKLRFPLVQLIVFLLGVVKFALQIFLFLLQAVDSEPGYDSRTLWPPDELCRNRSELEQRIERGGVTSRAR